MTPFAFSCLITASISLFFGTFVYLKKRKFLLGKLWGAVSFMVALWSMGLFGVITSHQENTAMVWQDILDISAIFIPVTFLHFVVCFLNCSRRIKRRMYFFYGAAIFLAIFSFSHWYKLGLVRMKGFNFWIEPGPLYFIFPLYFLGVTGYALYLLASSYFHSEGFKKTQIKYTFIASIIGFGGGATNFLPQLINVYPIGNYIVSFYVLVIFYIIIHYQFLNLKIIATEILITIASIALLVDIFLSRSLILALVKAAIFLAFIYLGQLSIKSVWREIKRRKQLEKLTAELKRSLLNEESQRQEIERLAKELRRSNASLQ
ncbi:hypothetical protein J7J81_00105, partial [bacterium]|nr:hypothetical protein [bacterium]